MKESTAWTLNRKMRCSFAAFCMWHT